MVSDLHMTLSAEEQHRHSQNANHYKRCCKGRGNVLAGWSHIRLRSSRDLLLVKRLIHFIFMHVSVNDYKYSILHEYDESYEMSPKCQDKKACDNHSTLRRYRTWRGITWRGFMIECSLQIARIPIIQQ